MKKYYLTQNLMYNCKHVEQKRWWHHIFGEPSLTVDFCTASGEIEATAKFISRGHNMGIFHKADLLICKHHVFDTGVAESEI